MEVNIFDKIYQIMTTYENLLKQKKESSSTNSFDVKNDPFFQFIFQNIHLSKPSSTFHSSLFQQENKKNSEQNEKSLYEKSLLSKNNSINEILKNNVEKNTKKEEKNQKFDQKINQDNEYIKSQDNEKIKNQDNEHENKYSSSPNKDNSFHHPEINEIENNTTNKMNSEVKKYMKSCYKKIILLCHPDKTKENKELYQEYFIKSQEYYENSFMIGLLYLFYLLKLKPPSLSTLIVNHIIIEIRHLQEKINLLQQ